ncbi:hypothetical protein JNUCC0626_42645 [Lentzea sp. JNUCC 0626]|uniref:hypothetical protein n=1 Tax=Lentzea sp. JNUCC 0626 TaxID=3367513 RepID=UPI00374A0218
MRRRWLSFYESDGRMWVRHLRQRLALEPGMTARIDDLGRLRRRLTISAGGEVLWSCRYWREPGWERLSQYPLLADTFVEEEDFDFGLRVSNYLAQAGGKS